MYGPAFAARLIDFVHQTSFPGLVVQKLILNAICSLLAEAVADLKAGKFVVVLDDADRENEGDLIMVADLVSQADMAFLVEHSSGYVCIGMTGEALDRLQLPLQVIMT